MRVALVCPYDLGRFGGVQDQVLELARWLREAGHEAWAVGPGPERDGVVSVGGSVLVKANGSMSPIALSPAVIGRVSKTSCHNTRPARVVSATLHSVQVWVVRPITRGLGPQPSTIAVPGPGVSP